LDIHHDTKTTITESETDVAKHLLQNLSVKLSAATGG